MVVGNLSDMVPYWEVAPDPTFWVATFQVVTSWVVKRQQDTLDHNHHMISDFAVLEISVAIVARLIEPLEEYEVLKIKDFSQPNCNMDVLILLGTMMNFENSSIDFLLKNLIYKNFYKKHYMPSVFLYRLLF